MMTKKKSLLSYFFPSRNDRLLKTYERAVKKINALESVMQEKTDAELKAQTTLFKERLEKGETLKDILPEAFATVREAGVRTLNMRHFDVQLVGGMALFEGKITEMATGEGKTLVASLPLYLKALAGKGVHLVTVNDYLAQRDAAQMSEIYGFLGLSTGVIINQMEPEDRKKAYHCDITYGTNNEFGFDYLRDNMAFDLQERVQRDLYFVVIDEVDSILIDESRTPLIISGALEDSSELYKQIITLVPKLEKGQNKTDKEEQTGDYYLDEKAKQAFLTEAGHEKMETLLQEAGLLSPEDGNLYAPSNARLTHYVNACLRAQTLFNRDVEYMIKNNEVMIVDEHTGRAMPGRRWSDGLHQALEAKEGVDIHPENQTLASITFQNFFRLYGKMSGMTGTADTEAFEFHQTYGMEVVVIPTNKPMIRKDNPDVVFLDQASKYRAIIKEITECVAKNQPVLIGTTSIESSELISQSLKKAKIKHHVLNAKHHEKEAHIIAQAGCPASITIATNMAGRGTDIVLGGNYLAEIEALGEDATQAQKDAIKTDWQKRNQIVKEAGGLHILGTERHEARRIDNQLRGRSGRQGDPGSSRFYVALDDHLVRIFGSDRLAGIMRSLGLKEDEALESSMISKQIAKAQKRVENYYFDIRKQLLEYDNVANDQRHVIYDQRKELLEADKVSNIVQQMFQDVFSDLVMLYIPGESAQEQWDVEGLCAVLKEEFQLDLDIEKWLQEDETLQGEAVAEKVVTAAKDAYKEKAKQADQASLHKYEQVVILQALDKHWRMHLLAMDHLRQSIHLRGYAQKDPKHEYKRESFDMFWQMVQAFKQEVVAVIAKVEVRAPEQAEVEEQKWRHALGNMEFQHTQYQGGQDQAQENDEAAAKEKPFVANQKVGRNDPCPCGSGKKFKHCHGKLH